MLLFTIWKSQFHRWHATISKNILWHYQKCSFSQNNFPGKKHVWNCRKNQSTCYFPCADGGLHTVMEYACNPGFFLYFLYSLCHQVSNASSRWTSEIGACDFILAYFAFSTKSSYVFHYTKSYDFHSQKSNAPIRPVANAKRFRNRIQGMRPILRQHWNVEFRFFDPETRELGISCRKNSCGKEKPCVSCYMWAKT